MKDPAKIREDKNRANLYAAANATIAALEDDTILEGQDTVFFALKPVTIESICTGCTDPLSPNYSPYAEVDDASC